MGSLGKLSVVAQARVTALLLAAAVFALPWAAPKAHAQGGPALTQADIGRIIAQAEAAAGRTASAEGLRSNTDESRGPVVKRPTKMVIAVVARNGKLLRAFAMPDAWVGSQDIAIAKARTAAFFSSDENALTSRVIGQLSLPHQPDGTGPAGPLWGIGNSNQADLGLGTRFYRNGIITFPGGVALYKDGKLVGGVGVSGDAVDQDEAVAFAGAAGFEPGASVVKLGYTAPRVPAFP